MSENTMRGTAVRKTSWLEIVLAALVAMLLSGLLAYGADPSGTQFEVALAMSGDDPESFHLEDLAVGESRVFTTRTGRTVTITRGEQDTRMVITGRDGEADREIVLDQGVTPGRRRVVVQGSEDGEPAAKRVIVLRDGGDREGIWLGENPVDEEHLRRHLEKVREHLERLDVTVEDVLSREELDRIVEQARRQAGRAREEADRAMKEMRIHVHRLSDPDGKGEGRVIRVPRPPGTEGGARFTCPKDGVRVRVPRDTEVTGTLACPVCGSAMERQEVPPEEVRVIRRTTRSLAPADPPEPPSPPAAAQRPVPPAPPKPPAH